MRPSTLHFLSVPCKGISSLLSAPQHYISFQPLTKEFHRYFQLLNITFCISPLQRNLIILFSAPQDYISYQSLEKEFLHYLQPLNFYYISYQSLTKEFHRHFHPLNIAFLISHLKKNFILTFSPSTLHLLSVPCKEISFSLSSPQEYISYQSLTKKFHPHLQPLNITLHLISPSQRNFILLSAPQRYISYQSLAKEFHSHLQSLEITFLISPPQRKLILTFNPSTFHFSSVSHKGISSLLSVL